jgi:hypothetical protein
MHKRLKSAGCFQNEDGNFICEVENRPKKVAIFGSARTNPDSGLYKSVERMSKELAQDGWVIVTGGGPGSMEAANKGAYGVCGEDHECSIAHAIYLPFEEAINRYVQSHTKHDEFFSRLETFSQCDAFVVSPGGIGTLLEMALIYQLIQVNHLDKKPVICVGRMWRTLRDWLENEMLDSEFLTYDEMKLIHYVDRFSEATQLLKGML